MLSELGSTNVLQTLYLNCTFQNFQHLPPCCVWLVIENWCLETLGLEEGSTLQQAEMFIEYVPGNGLLRFFIKLLIDCRRSPIVWAEVPHVHVDRITQKNYGKDGFSFERDIMIIWCNSTSSDLEELVQKGASDPLSFKSSETFPTPYQLDSLE